jgi:hypothetical protein
MSVVSTLQQRWFLLAPLTTELLEHKFYFPEVSNECSVLCTNFPDMPRDLETPVA